MCTRKDVCRGWFGFNHLICESMVYVVVQVQYVDGMLQGVVEVDPVCMEGVFKSGVG